MRAQVLYLCLAAFLLVGLAPAEESPSAGEAGASELTARRLYRLIKRFDFDERPLGNYESTPMRWKQLRGTGLPRHGEGVFDETIGQGAPPSFRLVAQTESVAFHYDALDIPVTPHTDYLITANIRAERMLNSRAFVAACLVDRFGERIPGSERVSDLVHSTGEAPEPWRNVRIELTGDYPDAFALKLTLWLLQASAFTDTPMLDRIERQDIFAQAWFDDIEIYRLPRARLTFSTPGNFVPPGETRSLLITMNNVTSAPLDAEVKIFDRDGEQVHATRVSIPVVEERVWFATAPGDRPPPQLPANPIPVELPELPPGGYEARISLTEGDVTLVKRSLRFAVLPRLPARGAARDDVGADLDNVGAADPAAAAELLTALGAGSVRIGAPLDAGSTFLEKQAGYARLTNLLQEFSAAAVETVGVLLADSRLSQATIAALRDSPEWSERLGPILAHFGGSLTTWQLGTEIRELKAADAWTPAEVDAIRGVLRRFLTLPLIIVPRGLSDPASTGDITSVLLPASLPARAIPRALEFLRHTPSTWLRIESPVGEPEERLADLARRVILAHAMAPQRIYVEAPFACSSGGGEPAWEPTEDFVPLRTLFHCLSGKRMVATLSPHEGVLAIVFEDAESNCMAIWSWGPANERIPLDLYLGGAPVVTDLWGHSSPAPIVGGRARLDAGPAPVLVQNLDLPLATLHASYSFSPTFIELHDERATPTLRLRNPYSSSLTGVVRLRGPGLWRIQPEEERFSIAPDEWLELPVSIEFPPRQMASADPVRVELELLSPHRRTLVFEEVISVGLRDVEVLSVARWEGDDLVVEQSLRNLSDNTLSFTAFCDAPNRSRLETLFRSVPPGAVMLREYIFPAARELTGASLRTGIDEIRGDRRLLQLVPVPD